MSAEENLKFGTVLKAAREEKNISMSHVSETLKLSIEIIEYIESSNMAQLPPAAFTCGYLRLFAKIVGINEEEVIELYNQSFDEVSSDALAQISDLPTQASSNDISMRVISYALIVIAVILLIVWYQGNENRKQDVVIVLDPIPNIVEEVVNSNLEQTKLEVSLEVANNDPMNEMVSDVITDEFQTLEVIETEVESLVEINDVVEDEQVNKIIALAKEASPIADVGSDVVVISAQDDCWVEVLDANEQLLYFSLLKKDQIAELKGQEPFKVFLGKATEVSISLNGIEYSILKHIRSNSIARFTMAMDNVLEKNVNLNIVDTDDSIVDE